MKTIIKSTLFSMAVMTTLAACDMDAPSKSSLDGSAVYSVYSLAESEVMSINQSFGETNSYRGRFLPYYGMNTDVETLCDGTLLSKKTDDKISLCNYATLPTNVQMNTDNNVYSKLYEGIERANLAIQGLKQYGSIDTRKDMGQLYGEALTMRAVIYNDLIKGWGDVPARFQPNDPTNVYMPRTSKDSIYLRLLSDLKEAEDYLYWPNKSNITKTTERCNKAFAKALRARIALYACGYALRGDGFRRSSLPELSQDNMMKIVKEECEDVINSNTCKLGSFKDNFVKLCQDNVTAGGESLWEIPFSDGRGRVLFTFAVKHNASDQYTKQPKGGSNGPTPTLFYDYDPQDVRRDITCVPYDWSKTLDDKGNASVELRSNAKWCFGKWRYEWMNRIVTSTNDDGVNWQYMRLADVYLMAAEAENYLSGPSAAWPYMEPVLSRALPADKVAGLKAKYCASKEAFLNGLVEQRGLEFAGEMLRKQDLIRWGIIDSKLQEEVQKLTDLANRNGQYAGYPDEVLINNSTNKDNIQVYGLDKGQDDADHIKALKAEGWSSKKWFIDSKTGGNIITDDYINGFFVDKPSTHSLWPIWQTFIDKSNGLLNNDGNLGQL